MANKKQSTKQEVAEKTNPKRWYDVVIKYAGTPDADLNKAIQKAGRGQYLRFLGTECDTKGKSCATRYSARKGSLAEKAATVFEKALKSAGKKADVVVVERSLERVA